MDNFLLKIQVIEVEVAIHILCKFCFLNLQPQ